MYWLDIRYSYPYSQSLDNNFDKNLTFKIFDAEEIQNLLYEYKNLLTTIFFIISNN